MSFWGRPEVVSELVSVDLVLSGTVLALVIYLAWRR